MIQSEAEIRWRSVVKTSELLQVNINITTLLSLSGRTMTKSSLQRT